MHAQTSHCQRLRVSFQAIELCLQSWPGGGTNGRLTQVTSDTSRTPAEHREQMPGRLIGAPQDLQALNAVSTICFVLLSWTPGATSEPNKGAETRYNESRHLQSRHKVDV